MDRTTSVRLENPINMHSQTLLVPLIILSHNHQNHNYRLMGPCFLHTTTTTNKIICKVANKQVITFSRLQWLQTAIARHSGGYFIQQFAKIYKNVQLIMHRNMELSNLYMNTNTRVFLLGSISASFISLLHNQEYSQNCKWVASYLAYTNRLIGLQCNKIMQHQHTYSKIRLAATPNSGIQRW